MTTRKMDDKDIERMIDIIGDGDLSAEAQVRLQQEGLWPLYESVRQWPTLPLCSATQMGKRVRRRARYTTVQVPWPHAQWRVTAHRSSLVWLGLSGGPPMNTLAA
jgi:hypothetical protein